MFKNSFFKEHPWISECNHIGSCFFEFQVKKLQDSGVQKLSRYIDMNLNNLISLKKHRLTPGVPKNVCFPAATTQVVCFAK